ncbi:MAG: 2-oxoacid:acceptor oxidoreductase family protein [Chloroflexi bacterium]|nr:2-oxoacid:acceptor oxidoreductase family protein [Chloroflexota bacterium]
MEKRDFVVRFAGEANVVTATEALASAAASAGYYVYTFATFPSQILGGPIWTQVRISTVPVFGQGDYPDLLVAFNKYGYDTHHVELRPGGVTIYNSKEFDLPEDGLNFGIDVEALAKEVGNPRATNFVTVGAISQEIGFSLDDVKAFNKTKYSRGRDSDAQIIESNNAALELGAHAARDSGISIESIAAAIPPDYEQVMVESSDMIGLGAMAAGLDYYVGYPISPATKILIWMESRMVGENRFVHQTSSEIESINTLIGAGFAGKKVMTATSGPGLSLMSEGLGLAWMAEIPMVVVNVQRGGPATGLPTKTEQSDLFTCIHPAHGDVRMPVIAPGDLEECLFGSAKAVNWAERYQGPVILLSEMVLSERTQNIKKPDLSKIVVEERKVYTGDNGYHRYASEELSAMPIPGGPGAYVANGSEHDEFGDTTHLASVHVHGTHRRFGKLSLLNDGTYEEFNPEASITMMPWGGTKGPAREAFEILRERGVDIGWFYTMFLHPLPDGALGILKSKDLVIVPELNYQGQWSALLRMDRVKAESITQYTGLPFKAGLLADRIETMVLQHQEGKILA